MAQPTQIRKKDDKIKVMFRSIGVLGNSGVDGFIER